MSLLSSPRRRRKLLWSGFVLALFGLAALAIVVLPKQGNPRGGSVQAPVTVPSSGAPSHPAQTRARSAAEAAVRPLADAFVVELMRRRCLSRAHALLSRELRLRYSLDNWRRGRDLPIPVAEGQSYSGGSSIIAYSGPRSVGLVAALTPSNETDAGTASVLLAMRFVKLNGSWRIDYLHSGHSTRYVDQTNYAPPGFLPWSHRESIWTWSVLALGLLTLIVIVALLDRLLSRAPRGGIA